MYEKSGRFLKKLSGNIVLEVQNRSDRNIVVTLTDNAYKKTEIRSEVAKNSSGEIVVPASESFGWYDFTVSISGVAAYARRYAGRVETGNPSRTDPLMGREVV